MSITDWLFSHFPFFTLWMEAQGMHSAVMGEAALFLLTRLEKVPVDLCPVTGPCVLLVSARQVRRVRAEDSGFSFVFSFPKLFACESSGLQNSGQFLAQRKQNLSSN